MLRQAEEKSFRHAAGECTRNATKSSEDIFFISKLTAKIRSNQIVPLFEIWPKSIHARDTKVYIGACNSSDVVMLFLGSGLLTPPFKTMPSKNNDTLRKNVLLKGPPSFVVDRFPIHFSYPIRCR